jgi:hypothetical protein
MSKQKTFWESFKEHFPLEMRAATENVLMAPSQITIGKQENILRGRVESLKQLKNHVFLSNSNSNSNSNSKPTTPTPKNNAAKVNTKVNTKVNNKAASRSSTGSTNSVRSPTNMFGGKGRRTRRKRRN